MQDMNRKQRKGNLRKRRTNHEHKYMDMSVRVNTKGRNSDFAQIKSRPVRHGVSTAEATRRRVGRDDQCETRTGNSALVVDLIAREAENGSRSGVITPLDRSLPTAKYLCLCAYIHGRSGMNVVPRTPTVGRRTSGFTDQAYIACTKREAP